MNEYKTYSLGDHPFFFRKEEGRVALENEGQTAQRKAELRGDDR
jgi:hypothetical protein